MYAIRSYYGHASHDLQAFCQLAQRTFGNGAAHCYLVFLFVIKGRVGKPVVNASVVGQQKQACGILVQTRNNFV